MKLSGLSALLLLGVLVFAHIWLDQEIHPRTSVHQNTVLPEPEIRIPATASTPEISSLHAKYACLMDSTSHRILYGKEENAKVPMASTTKIMTALLALESGRTEETVTASAKAASMPKVHLGMRAGNKYKLKDLLYSLMLESHNDTAVAIAEHLGGSIEGFATLMNQKAAALGMAGTHFVTPNGLDADGHYSTASDMCLLAGYAIQNPAFLQLVQTKSYRFSDYSGKHTYSLSNKDAFLSYYEGALGIKTGFTGKAGYCFVGAAKRMNQTLVSSVLACGWPPNKSWKWTDTKTLMDYGMENFSSSTLPIQDLTLVRIPMIDAKKRTVSLCQPSPIPATLGRSDEITVIYDIPDSLYAPIRKTVSVGTISFYINNKFFRKVEVFPSESIEKSDFSDTIENVLSVWMEIFGM